MKQLVLVLFVTLAFFSCKKDEKPVLTGNDNLIGTWINPWYEDTLITYSKSDALVENEIGFTFNANNKLISRQNNSWCGTPPIVTADYTGTWNWNDSVVEISVGYWGGTSDFSWKVVTLNEQKLVVAVIKSAFHEGNK